MATWTFVQHVHTHHSFDSLAKPVDVARRAEAVGIEVLAVTDHDTWRGSVEVREAVERLGLDVQVVLGTERNTDRGDVIGLFLQQDVKERDAARFCDAVHEQGGLVVLPHPLKWHRLDEGLLSRVDLIEVYNARCTRAENDGAAALARQRGLPELVGPDAHRPGEMTLARIEFAAPRPDNDEDLKRALLTRSRRFHFQTGEIWDEWISQAVKLLKRPSPVQAWRVVRGAVRRMVKPEAYVLDPPPS